MFWRVEWTMGAARDLYVMMGVIIMSDRVLVHFTQADLENEFAKKGINPNPKTIEILADVLATMPVAELIFNAAAQALKVVGREEFSRRFGKEYISCLKEDSKALEDKGL